MDKTKLKWYARKRLWCRLPWTFTKYGMSEDRIFVETGILNLHQRDVRLYRILNISLTRSLTQRIFGMGTIHLDSNDKDLECFELKNILDSEHIKEMISDAVEMERKRNKVSTREFMSGDGELEDDSLEDDMEH